MIFNHVHRWWSLVYSTIVNVPVCGSYVGDYFNIKITYSGHYETYKTSWKELLENIDESLDARSIDITGLQRISGFSAHVPGLKLLCNLHNKHSVWERSTSVAFYTSKRFNLMEFSNRKNDIEYITQISNVIHSPYFVDILRSKSSTQAVAIGYVVMMS